jgi:hypothetical protein
MRSPYANIKNKSPRLISNQHNIKGPNKEKELRNQNEKKKKKQNIFAIYNGYNTLLIPFIFLKF